MKKTVLFTFSLLLTAAFAPVQAEDFQYVDAAKLTVIGKDFTSSALKGKRVALLSGGIYDYVRAFMSGRIVGAVVSNPKAVFDAKNVPKDPEAAFNKRYLLITPENYKEMIEQYNIFKR